MQVSAAVHRGSSAVADSRQRFHHPLIRPVLVGLLVFVSDFGVLLCVRVWERGEFFLPWGNKTFLIGDSVFLPAYAAFATLAVSRAPRPAKGWLAWNLAIVAGGVLLALALDFVAIANGHNSVLWSPRPSKLYHALIVPPMFWFLLRMLPGLWHTRSSRAALLAFAALAAYGAIAAMELHYSAAPSVRLAVSAVGLGGA